MGYLAKFRIPSCVLILAIITTAMAQDQSTLSMAGCVDDNAMASCQAAANTEFNNCVASSGNQKTQLLACGCEHYIQNINCAASACWNRVYECNYQGYVTWYLANCPTATTPVPYFPIPNGAPDACSCNLGAVYLAISSAFQQSTSCSNSAHGGDAVNEVYAQQACICCGISSALTSMFTTCPTTDPHLIGLNRILQEQTNLNQPWDNCGKSLSQYNCVGDLGFAQVGSGFYVPSNTPDANAIKGLMSNMGGVVESPGEGPTFTYTAGDGRQYTITAATVNGKGGNSEGSSASGPSSAASSGSSGSSSSSDQSKHNAGEKLNVSMAAALIITLLYCIV